jgi:tetratricopeptide (TPR) repeat protein
MSGTQPDRLASLKSEHEFLLISLRDLDAEAAAGDIDEIDYDELKNAYTVRTAAVIREMNSLTEGSVKPKAPEVGRTNLQKLAWFVGLVGFVVVAGYVLAQATGERGLGDELTGNITRTPREQVLLCQNLGPSQIQESLQCYQDVLDVDPDNVEAHTYRGWALVLVVGSAQQNGDTEAAEVLLPQAMAHFDRAIEIDPEFPDVRAFRSVVFEAEGELEKACEEMAVLDSVNPPPFIDELTEPLRVRLACGSS